MKFQRYLKLLPVIGLGMLLTFTSGQGQAPTPTPTPAEPPKFPDFTNFVKGAKVYDGLFTLHQKDEHVYAEITQFQFDKPYLVPIAIAKGGGVGGTTLNFDTQWVITFKRVGDKIFLSRKNVRYTAKAGTPAAKALDTTYTDSVLMALPIKAVNLARSSVLIDFNQIFFSDFGDLGVGYLDRDRTTWNKIKAYKKNVELQVSATFGSSRTSGIAPHGDDAVVDSRGTNLIVHYGIVELPEPGYQPRIADDRVGYFTTVMKDFSKDSIDTAFVRYANRWRLDRADGSPWKEGAKLVPPKKKIVFWIENSVPDEFRAAVRDGILEWNKAFEKIGFRDAIEVRQQEGEDFDPEDMSYATFRWITSETPYAIGPSRANPFTGEILDADILFDASMVRAYRGESRVYRDDKGNIVEPASNIQAARYGWDLPLHPLDELRANSKSWNDRAELQVRNRLAAVRHGYCQCSHHKMTELGLAMMSLANQVGVKEGEKIPEELLIQAVKETVMHEVGHTLGLRHNFKASTMLKNDQLHDMAITSKSGLVASVMDYTPSNIAPKGTKQGHYFTPTIGPYDYWAIEYAYTPNATEEQLAKIAAKCADPKHIYSTDEDLYGSNDPLVNQWDLGSDPLQFAKDRIKLSKEMFPTITNKVVDKGEGYQRARSVFDLLLRQYGNAGFLAAKHIGGSALYRDHKGDPDARDPFVPTAPAKQREALKFLQEEILTDKPFQFPPELLRKLAADRWMHWGNERAMRTVEYPLTDRILAIHRSSLNELLDPSTLTAVQNVSKLTDPKDKPLLMSEVFGTITDSVFSDLKDKNATANDIRRNLQREYVSKLSGLVLGRRSGGSTNFIMAMFGGGSSSTPADARSLARYHLKQIETQVTAAAKATKDVTQEAHLLELKEQIGKVLTANVTAGEP